jgi:hypothetical protein
MARQVILAVGGQQLTRRRLIFRHALPNLTGRWIAVHQQPPRVRFVEMTLRVVGAQQIFEFAFRPRENFWRRQPYCEARFVNRDDFDRHVLQ